MVDGLTIFRTNPTDDVSILQSMVNVRANEFEIGLLHLARHMLNNEGTIEHCTESDKIQCRGHTFPTY